MYSLSAIKFLVREKKSKKNSIWFYAEIISHCEAILVFSIDTKNKTFCNGPSKDCSSQVCLQNCFKGSRYLKLWQIRKHTSPTCSSHVQFENETEIIQTVENHPSDISAKIWGVWVMEFNTTFNNISVILWR